MINQENSMQNMSYNEISTIQNGMTVKLEFPQTYEDEKAVKREVKQILVEILWEYLKKT